MRAARWFYRLLCLWDHQYDVGIRYGRTYEVTCKRCGYHALYRFEQSYASLAEKR